MLVSLYLKTSISFNKLRSNFMKVNLSSNYKKSYTLVFRKVKNCINFRDLCIWIQPLIFLYVVDSQLISWFPPLSYFCNFFCGPHICPNTPAGEASPLHSLSVSIAQLPSLPYCLFVGPAPCSLAYSVAHQGGLLGQPSLCTYDLICGPHISLQNTPIGLFGLWCFGIAYCLSQLMVWAFLFHFCLFQVLISLF